MRKDTEQPDGPAYTYILACADGTWYTGWTSHLLERVKVHDSGKGAKYTRSRRPVCLIYAERHPAKKEAMRREYAIKQLTREEKEKLVRQTRMNHAQGKEMGRIYYLMGKSASGKDMIYETLRESEYLNLKPLVIYTTRPMRKGETDGVEYHFTDEQHLRTLQEEGKIIELRQYQTIQGLWSYFTVNDGSVDLSGDDRYLGIGTLESYRRLRDYYGSEKVIPLYIEVDDGIRLERALKRERKQAEPQYEEMCRRFLADQEDFSEEILERTGICRRFLNNTDRQDCMDEITAYILSGN